MLKINYPYCAGVAEMVFTAIQSADIDMRPELYKHIGKL